MRKNPTYWIKERREILRQVMLEPDSTTWIIINRKCKERGIKSNKFALNTIASMYKFRRPYLKMGGYRRGILRTPEVIETVRQVILKAESWQDVADMCYDKGLKAKYWVFRQIAYEYSLPHPNIKHGGNGFFT